MKIRILVVLAVFVLTAGTAIPQSMVHENPRAFMETVATAMGTDRINTMEYSGAGQTRAFGQSFSTDTDWPRFDMPSYTRVIDFGANYSRVDYTRTQGNNPPRGGGGTPIQGEQQRVELVNGDYAWNMNGNNAQPAVNAAERRQLDIVLTPHGFVKAALQADDLKAVTMMMAIDDSTIGKPMGPAGRKVTYVAFTYLDKYTISGAIDDQNMVERVQTFVGNPVLGDQNFQWDYKEYRDWNGVKFPNNLHLHSADIRVNGHHGDNINVTSLRINVPVTAASVPDNVRQATSQPVRAEAQEVTNGVWLIGGGSHNSVAVEFDEFITVIEAPQNEARSLAVITEVQRVIPNKPIRYVVVTHHHFDHSGGIRTYVAHGATLVVHEGSREFYDTQALYPYPRSVEPDILSTYYPRFAPDKFPVFETVKPPSDARGKLVLSDGERVLEVHSMRGLGHAADMLLAYLPQQRILVNADLYSPRPGQPAPAPSASMTTLNENIQRLGLEVDQHVPIHGAPASHEDFLSIVGN